MVSGEGLICTDRRAPDKSNPRAMVGLAFCWSRDAVGCRPYTRGMTNPATDEVDSLPYVTSEIQGVGGVIKLHDEDFIVEELPRYPASGEGTHVYFMIEKRGLTTPNAIGFIAKRLGRRPRDIGYAGLKDAHGVTRQWLSVEHVEPADVASLDLGRVKVISVTRHTNKIKLGHLAGNRFTILVRNADVSAMDRVASVMDTLSRRGVPNYFGRQRFGVRGDNAAVGLAALREDWDSALSLILGRPQSFERDDIQQARRLFDEGDYAAAAKCWPHRFHDQANICRKLIDGDARQAWRAVPHGQRKFYFSALQSLLFNRVLARRVDELDRVRDGDVAWIHRNGACFDVTSADAEQSRCAAFEISPTGPLFGKKMKEPTGLPGQWECEVSQDAAMQIDRVHAAHGAKLDGARRPLRVPLGEPTSDTGAEARGPFVRLAFTLPPGAYATVVTREVCKTAPT